jgi:hypothetical protein
LWLGLNMGFIPSRLNFDTDSVAYFNKLPTSLLEEDQIKIDGLVKLMKKLSVWDSCEHAWLFLPEHSGISIGSTTGTYYDLKGLVNLSMQGFSAAGQTQTVNGPHLWQSGDRVLASYLEGTLATAGVFGGTNWANGEDLGCIWTGLWDPWTDWFTDQSNGRANGNCPFQLMTGTTSNIGPSQGAIYEMSTAGSGNQIAPTCQYFSRRFRRWMPTTRGIRAGVISNQGIVHHHPLSIIWDPTASFQYVKLDANNWPSTTVTGNEIGVYGYYSFWSFSRLGNANVPSSRQFDRRPQNIIQELGNNSYAQFPPYDLVNGNIQGFTIDTSVPASVSSPIIRLQAVKQNTTDPTESTGSNPFWFFLFGKNTNFGYRRAEKLKELYEYLGLNIAKPQRMPPSFSACDRSRLSDTRNRTGTETLPIRLYFGLNDGVISLHSNDPANSADTFQLDLYCLDSDYASLPASVSGITSANFSALTDSLKIYLHDGSSRTNVTLPTSPTSFVLGAGETISRDVGLGLKTYRKICSATYTVASNIIRRMYAPQFSKVGSDEVVVHEFNLNHNTTYDSDALSFCTSASITSLADKTRINQFVVRLKALGLWTNNVYWPLRSGQNAGTGNTVYSLGGLGTYNGTLNNSPTWVTDGIDFSAANSDMSTTISVAAAPTAVWFVNRPQNAQSNNSAIFQTAGLNQNGRQWIYSNSGSTNQNTLIACRDTWQTNVLSGTLASFPDTATRTSLDFVFSSIRSSTSAYHARARNVGATTTISGWSTSNFVRFGFYGANASQSILSFMGYAQMDVTTTLYQQFYEVYKSTLGQGLNLS